MLCLCTVFRCLMVYSYLAVEIRVSFVVFLLFSCLFLAQAGSFNSGSPAGSLTSRYPQTGAYLEGFETPPSPRYSFTDPITANMGGPVTFEAPELPEETLMEVRSRFPDSKSIYCFVLIIAGSS